jgi:hypothetical protein
LRPGDFFHVGAGRIEPGAALHPYELVATHAEPFTLVRRALDRDPSARAALLTRTGRLRHRFRADPEMQLVILEAIFERVRARHAPTLSGRLDAVFLWPTLDLARDFRARFRPNGTIHRCRIVDGKPLTRDASLVVVGVDLAAVLDDEARRVEQHAVRYWSSDTPIAYPEVLVHGTVVVVEAISPPLHAGEGAGG